MAKKVCGRGWKPVKAGGRTYCVRLLRGPVSATRLALAGAVISRMRKRPSR